MSDAQDAARYRWLRQRLQVRALPMMSGTTADCLEVRIGCARLDGPLPYTSSPAYWVEQQGKLDAAIDAEIARLADSASDG